MNFAEQLSTESRVSPKQDQISRELERLNQLRQQVILQEQKVQKLNISEDGDSDAFIKSLIHMKEREIALALMRVAELTRQLEQLKQGSVDRHILTDSTLVNAQLLEKQPDLVRSIIGPLSSAAVNSKTSIPSTAVSSIGISIPDTLSSIKETVYSCPPVTTPVVPSSASQNVDCNDNLVTQKSAKKIVYGDNALRTASVSDVAKSSPGRNLPLQEDARVEGESVEAKIADVNCASLLISETVSCLNRNDSKSCGIAVSKTVDVNVAAKKIVKAEGGTPVMHGREEMFTTPSGTGQHQSSPILRQLPNEQIDTSDSGSECSMVEHSDVSDDLSPETNTGRPDSVVEVGNNSSVAFNDIARVVSQELAADSTRKTQVKEVSFVPHQEIVTSDTGSECSMVEHSDVSDELLTECQSDSHSSVIESEKSPGISAVEVRVVRQETSKDAPHSVSRVGEQFPSVAAGDVDSAMLVLRGKSMNSHPASTSSPSVARYQQRLSASTASRYSSISDRLYGSWFDASANRVSRIGSPALTAKTAPVPASVSADVKMSSNGEALQLVDQSSVSSASPGSVSAAPKAPANGETGLMVVSSSVGDLPAKNEDSISESETESSSDDTFNSSDEDVADFRDSVEDVSRSRAGGLMDPYSFQHNDSFTSKELKHWHHHSYATPPPKRLSFLRQDTDRLSDEVDIDDVDEEFVVARRGSRRSKSVTFDPFTLSLNAALEGELETLKATFMEVDDPNKANEDGLTVLHNAVCSGNSELLEFLIDCGCDVNVTDHDGWTPLHCAASSNNVRAVKILVEHGASLMALSWHPDYETPLQKCVPDSPGFKECVKYMTDMLELVGTANDSRVYATSNYVAVNDDELSFEAGEQLTIVRQGDKAEPLWWWARNMAGVEGYVPPNLVAFYKQSAARTLIQTSC